MLHMLRMSLKCDSTKSLKSSEKIVSRSGRHQHDSASAAAVFLACVVVYSATMSRSISGGDAGELAVSVCQLGVAHPPGYPLFTVLYHLVWRCTQALTDPLDITPALIFNLFSVILTSLGIALLSSSILTVSESHLVAAITALAFAFLPTVWLYSGQAEVFALHIFLVNLMLRSLFWVYSAFCLKRVCIFFFIASLSLTNQHTSILFVFPFCCLLLAHKRAQLFRPKAVILAAFSVAAGMSPYLLLTYISAKRNLDSWGDLTTIQGFFRHLLRQEYGTFQLASTEIATDHPFLARISVYIQHLLSESQYLFAILGTFGMLTAICDKDFQKLRCALSSIVVSYFFYIIVFHYLANLDLSPLLLGVQMRFWIQPNMIIFICAGIAWAWLRRRIGVAIDAVVVAVFTMQLAQNISKRDFSGDFPVRAYGQSVLTSLPPNAIALLNGDLNNNAPKYLVGCENQRTDLRLISLQLMSWEWFVPTQARHYPDVKFPGEVYHPFKMNGFSIRQFLDANWKRFPIFLCGSWKLGDSSHEQFYELIPSGICNKVVRKDSMYSAQTRAQLIRKGALSLPKLAPFDASRISPDLWESVVYHDVWHRKVALFNELAVYAVRDANDSKQNLRIAVRMAESLFEDTPAKISELQPEIFRNAGVIFGTYSIDDAKYEQLMLQSWRMYMNMTGNTDESISHILQQNYNPYRHTTIVDQIN